MIFFKTSQVGLMLRGMGFDKNTYIFLASGKIYNSEKYMAPLLEMFPNLLTKDMLALDEELDPFKVCMVCGFLSSIFQA
jgi:hypothetical protein